MGTVDVGTGLHPETLGPIRHRVRVSVAAVSSFMDRRGVGVNEEMRYEECAPGRFVASPIHQRDKMPGLYWGVVALDNGALVFQFSEN